MSCIDHIHLTLGETESNSESDSRTFHTPPHQLTQSRYTCAGDISADRVTDGHMHGRPRWRRLVDLKTHAECPEPSVKRMQ
jgi:hypothetical protein